MKARISFLSLWCLLVCGLRAQPSIPSGTPSDPLRATEELRKCTRDLNTSLKAYYAHLNEAIARHDHGRHLKNGRLLSGADADLTNGPADLMSLAVQKLNAFRMLATRADGHYDALPVADLDRIQRLLMETRKRVDDSTAILRRLLVVPMREIDLQKDAIVKARRDQLTRARALAEEAARQAILALPTDQPEADSRDQTAQRAWDGLARGISFARPNSGPASNPAAGAGQTTALAFPIRIERRKRTTLLNEVSYRMAVTDSGTSDDQGRHVFYQEEWVQRGGSVMRFRWRVAVEATTGDHVLLKRYTPIELHGDLEDLYNHRDREYLWYMEPSENASEPSRAQVESALACVAYAREAVRAAAQQFRAGVSEALARQDRDRNAAKERPVDGELPETMRQTLFAIRAHLAHVASFLEAESNVRRAILQAESAVKALEPIAAWSNKLPDSAFWAQVLDRSDREIDLVKAVETDALRALPPDISVAEESFPALSNNMIVRIRPNKSRNPQDTAVRCLEEVWRMESAMHGTREVRRSVSLILIDPATGSQTRVGADTRFYKAPLGEVLEEIFDEYASDDVNLGG